MDITKVGLAQIAPVWLNKQATIEKVTDFITQAGKDQCHLVAFGEALLPGYPFWSERTDGARFNSEIQKDLFSYYSDQAVHIPSGDLDPICTAAKAYGIHVILGTIERADDRGGHSLYCSLVYIDNKGNITNVHRKLRPTYDERLNWAPGDGYGLRVFPLNKFTLGALNCWENWMPLTRTALYGQGEDLHVAIWPGSDRNTKDITRFMAMEARSFVLSVSGLMRSEDISSDIPYAELIRKNAEPLMANGGSCIASPDGNWVIEPSVGKEILLVAELDHSLVRKERQNFDVSGHYSRPDVTRLIVNRERQGIVGFED